MRIQYAVSAIAKSCITRSVVLNSYLGKTFKRFERICRFSAYQFHNTFLGFPDSARKRFLDGCGTKLISVVVITIWFWVMTYVVFWAAGVGRRWVMLLYTGIRTTLHVVIRVHSVIRSVWLRNCFWGIFWYGSRSVPHFISCLFWSYCNFG